MSNSGPPRSSFGFIGGPGFILALLTLFGLGLGGLYLVSGGMLQRSGSASLSLPGSLGGSPSSGAGGDQPEALQPMQPMTAGGDTADTAPPGPQYPIITEDLSPLDLLVRHTPAPGLALDDAVAENGDARRFRRPSAAPADAKRIALVVTGLGRDRAQTAQAILALPPDVTLSFSAESADLADWIDAARAYGHEVLVDLELGSADSLPLAPGEAADDRLLAELGPPENLRRLEALLARAPKVAGVTMRITDAFLGDAAALTPILARLQEGGWIVVGLPVTAPLTVAADLQLATPAEPGDFARQARALKSLARQRGAALAVADAGSATQIADRLAELLGERAELSLVPASALVEDWAAIHSRSP